MSTAEENPQAETAPNSETPTPTMEQPVASPESAAPIAAAPVGAPPTNPAPTNPAPAARPRPEFGEYAPDGWEWKPEAATVEPAAAGAQGFTPNSGVPGTVPGVPHNLGAGSALPRKNARSNVSQQSSGAPYIGEAPKRPGAQPTLQPGATGSTDAQGQLVNQGVQAKRPNMADRIITSLLLTVGAFGALQYGFALFGLRMQIAVFGEILGIENFSSPQWLDIFGKVTGVAVLAIYAITLVYSIRRLRSGKLTFWVPLVAAVVVFVIVNVVMAIAFTSDPELVKAASDPEALSKIIEHFLSLQAQPAK